jgi:predicted phosphoadenosine phosphosulfate sulfurtransferase
MVGRVNGVNFTGIYGGTTAMGWKSITKPKHFTWKQYLDFLLGTLPKQTAMAYREKFETSVKFWKTRGGVLSEKTIAEAKKSGAKIVVGNATNYKTTKLPVRFDEYPDDLPDVEDFKTVPSYKRMCVCILKNDHYCKYMGFSTTREEIERRNKALKKYQGL